MHDGNILLNRCRYPDGSLYYDLPGGGQRIYETMEAALIREVQEETGYTVRLLRFAGAAEEIYTSQFMQEKYPEYTHRILHLFVAELTDVPLVAPCEKDLGMEKSVWLPLKYAEQQTINPEGIAGMLRRIVENGESVYLGSKMIHDFE